MTVRVRRRRALRRHRRPRPQEAVPGALPDGGRRHAGRRRAGGRGVVVRLDRRRSARPHPRSRCDESQRRRRRRQRSTRCATGRRYVAGDYREADTFDRLGQGARRRRGAAVLPGHPAVAVRRRGPGPRPGRPPRRRSGRGREAVRARPRVGHRARRGHPRRLPRGPGLPHRPLPRQGGHREPAGVPLRQLDARTGVEPQLHLLGADHHGRGVRRREPRQVLRLGRRAEGRRPEPPAPDRRLPGHGAAGRRRRPVVARREGQAVPPGPDAASPTSSCGASTATTSTRTASRPAPTPRPTSPPGSRSTRGGGPGCRGSSARASACRSPRPRRSSSSTRRPGCSSRPRAPRRRIPTTSGSA